MERVYLGTLTLNRIGKFTLLQVESYEGATGLTPCMMTEENDSYFANQPGERLTTLVELLAAIKRRPAMYLTRRYISCLKSFLDAWLLLAYQHGINVEAECMGEFQDWVVAKYRITSSHSWADIILFHSQDECDALDNFFQFFDEFQQQMRAEA